MEADFIKVYLLIVQNLGSGPGMILCFVYHYTEETGSFDYSMLEGNRSWLGRQLNWLLKEGYIENIKPGTTGSFGEYKTTLKGVALIEAAESGRFAEN